MNNECKLCGKEISAEHVQQGEMHMSCYHEGITVFRISLHDDPKNLYLEKDVNIIPDLLESCGFGEGYTITKPKMAAGDYFYLPEFAGF